MLNTMLITTFLFQKAHYFISNDQGNNLLLKIDYKNNRFQIKNLNKIDVALNQETKRVASDLLLRKYQVNFANLQKIAVAQDPTITVGF